MEDCGVKDTVSFPHIFYGILRNSLLCAAGKDAVVQNFILAAAAAAAASGCHLHWLVILHAFLGTIPPAWVQF